MNIGSILNFCDMFAENKIESSGAKAIAESLKCVPELKVLNFARKCADYCWDWCDDHVLLCCCVVVLLWCCVVFCRGVVCGVVLWCGCGVVVCGCLENHIGDGVNDLASALPSVPLLRHLILASTPPFPLHTLCGNNSLCSQNPCDR